MSKTQRNETQDKAQSQRQSRRCVRGHNELTWGEPVMMSSAASCVPFRTLLVTDSFGMCSGSIDVPFVVDQRRIWEQS
jgi:hypothetical protein